MQNPLKALARLFARTENPVVSALFAQTVGKPLLVHPQIGEQLIAGYLRGAVDAPEPIMGAGPATASPAGSGQGTKRIAVLNITGPLVDRPQPGLCDDGPLSYEAIRDAFDTSMSDDNVSAIVLRMRSPGGMVDGCFDLTDHIHASRGTKPIVAVVDNMAYSAGYAIAAACDQIWVSRTGGVGSVGVYGYHLDQTAFNEQMGVKITLIYAGDHKVEMSPHVQLSEGAQAREQAIVDDMYGMFTTAVAKYRGMKQSAVVATKADTYIGQAAVDVGFATHLGTLRDALASLAESDADRSARAAKEEADRRSASRAAAAVAVVAAGLKPDVTAALLHADSGIDEQTIAARMEHAQAVIDLCVAAGDRALAHDYIVKNVAIETCRSQLLALKAEDGPEVITAQPRASDMPPAPRQTRSDSIYSRRREAAAGAAPSSGSNRS
jgi:signal peptide peptidase SppA